MNTATAPAECPNCGSRWPFTNLGETDKIVLEKFQHRWLCLNCFHIWIDGPKKELEWTLAKIRVVPKE